MVPPVNNRITKLYGPYQVGTILRALPLGFFFICLFVRFGFGGGCCLHFTSLLTQLILTSQKVDTMIISIVHMKKLSYREVK